MTKRGAFLSGALSAVVLGAMLCAAVPGYAQSIPDDRGKSALTGHAPLQRDGIRYERLDDRRSDEVMHANSHRLDYYRPLDQAYAFVEAIGSSPPDFGFTFDGEDAWGWESQSGDLLLMEETRNGSIQYFFDGRDNALYLIRTNDRSYTFDDDNLYAVYDSRGQAIGRQNARGDARDAESLFERGIAIYNAASNKDSWNANFDQRWTSSVGPDYTFDGWNGWNGWWRSYPGWQSYYDWDNYYAYDRAWRYNYGRQYYDWRRHGHHGRPPQRPSHPAITQPVPGNPAGPIAGRPGWHGDGVDWSGNGEHGNGQHHRPGHSGEQPPNRPGLTGRDPIDGIEGPSIDRPGQPGMVTRPPVHDHGAGGGVTATPPASYPGWERPIHARPGGDVIEGGQTPHHPHRNWNRPDGPSDNERPNPRWHGGEPSSQPQPFQPEPAAEPHQPAMVTRPMPVDNQPAERPHGGGGHGRDMITEMPQPTVDRPPMEAPTYQPAMEVPPPPQPAMEAPPPPPPPPAMEAPPQQPAMEAPPPPPPPPAMEPPAPQPAMEVPPPPPAMEPPAPQPAMEVPAPQAQS